MNSTHFPFHNTWQESLTATRWKQITAFVTQKVSH